MAQEKETNLAGIEVIKANSDDILAAFSLFAAVQLLTENGKIVERRIRALPYGYRDYKLALKMATRVAEDILQTFPAKKLMGMKQQVRNMFCKVYCGKPVVPDPDYVYLLGADFEEICYAAHEKCKMCDDWNCDRCSLGKQFDKHLIVERDQIPWAMMNLEPRDGVK